MPAPASTEQRRLDLLARAELRVLGRMPWSSNATLLVELVEPTGDGDDDPTGDEPTDDRDGSGPTDDHDDGDGDSSGEPAGPALGRAIYKPAAGERPLWDFPEGLHRREVAAYDLAAALGWDLVPPTIRRDGPFGDGSLQWFVEADYDDHYFELLEDGSCHDQLRRLAAFDVVANSADRKGGHVLRDADGHLWAIDNGLCFHEELKLRTVIWDFAGEPLPADLAEDLDRLVTTGVPEAVAAALHPGECEALLARARGLLAGGVLPSDPTGRRYPWPLV